MNLAKQLAYVDGAWIDAEDGKTFTVIDPATGETLASIPDMSTPDVNKAVIAAQSAFPAWATMPSRERSQTLRRWHDLIKSNLEELAVIMTKEQGKPLVEARLEVAGCAAFIEWFSEEAKRVYGDIIPSSAADSRFLVLRQPIGPVAAITPWNFPSAMIGRKAGAALAAGCTLVLKPAPDTPMSALALAALAEAAGVPAGVFNVVTASHERTPAIGREFSNSTLIRKLSFTGSTDVGRLLLRESSATIKKVSLELGGNAPFLVFEDADLDNAIEQAVAAKFRNSGQTCITPNRFLIQESIYDLFRDGLVERVNELKVGNGLDPHSQQGPLINEAAVQKVESLIKDAVECGAKLLTGGNRHALGGTFFEPTVLDTVPPTARVSREEVFGPVAPLYRFKDEVDAVRLANDTEYGLASYLFTRDVGRLWRVSEALESGMISANTGLFVSESAPFGGIKQSGIGREGSRYGIEEYVEMKYICLGAVGGPLQ